jgi:hypothetical protein
MSWTWTGAGGTTSWNNAANWTATGGDSGYPTNSGSGTVYIGAGATVALPSAEQVSYLYITGSGTVNLTGAYTLSLNNSLNLAAGSTLNLGSTTVVSVSGPLNVSGTGTATLSGGTVTTNGNLVNVASGETLVLHNTNLTASNTSGAGTVTLDGSTVTFLYGTPTTTINFATVTSGGTQNVLVLPSYASGASVTGFGYGDSISVGGATLKLVATGTTSGGLSVYTIEDSSGKSYGTTTLAPGTPGATGASSGSTIPLTNSSGDNTYPCFYPGTLLATAEGEIAVEDVTIGMLLKTASGALLPVRWVGWSEVSTVFGDPLRVLPIRIQAGALAEGTPARDLLVSPDHALFIDGVLVQAAALVNDTTIFRETNVPECFRYYHVELDSHELLLAENCPAESFVDNIDRMNFHNWDVREAPAVSVMEMGYPRAKSTRQVPAAILTAIAARAAAVAAAQAA